MFWKTTFLCHPGHAEDLGTAFEDYGCSVSWFESSEDSNVWVIEILTTEEPSQDRFASLLQEICSNLQISTPTFFTEFLPETDWLEATWRNFPPHQIGRYYIYGSHTTPTPPEGSLTLEINAATAFGSGEHETTTACLLTLDTLASQGIVFKNPLDMGCGSGILAMAIAKTWNVQVIAADNDPESVRVAQNNSSLNHCGSLIQTFLSDGFANPDVIARKPYDLIVANILAGPLVDMAHALSQSLSPQGYVILSGLLTRDKEIVTQAYEEEGLTLLSHRTLNNWEALLLQKNS